MHVSELLTVTACHTFQARPGHGMTWRIVPHYALLLHFSSLLAPIGLSVSHASSQNGMAIVLAAERSHRSIGARVHPGVPPSFLCFHLPILYIPARLPRPAIRHPHVSITSSLHCHGDAHDLRRRPTTAAAALLWKQQRRSNDDERRTTNGDRTTKAVEHQSITVLIVRGTVLCTKSTDT